MKQVTRKLMSLLLALAMALSLLPATAMADESSEGNVTSVAITCSPQALSVTTAMTGREVTQSLRSATAQSAGPQATVDLGWSFLVKKLPDGVYSSLENSDDLLNTSDEYYFCFNVEDANGYRWDVNRLPDVTVNGAAVPADWIRWMTQSPTGCIYVYFRLIPTPVDGVASVSVSAPATTVSIGHAVQCTARVNGSVDTVNWTVIGANSAGTAVDSTGRLVVGSDETAERLTVRATSTYDSSKYGEVTLNVSQQAMSIDSVTVTPATATAYRGGRMSFYAIVRATGEADKRVTWSIVSAVSEKTFLDGDDRDGTLHVSSTETADTIVLRATSVYDPSKYGEATVTVADMPKVTSVAITYDASAVLPLTPEMTGSTVTRALQQATEKDAGDQAFVDLGYSYLAKKIDAPDGSYTFQDLFDSDDPLDPADEYYFCFNLEEVHGYWWDVDRLPDVTVNGSPVPAEQMKWYTCASTGSLDVFFRVNMGQEAPTPPTITSQPADTVVTAGGRASFSVAADGEDLAYQWQYATPNGQWKNSGASSARTATLSFNATAAQNGYQYRCVVTGSGGSSVTSDIAFLTVSAGVTITSQPADVTVTAGGRASFSVAADGEGLTYQWQVKTPNGQWKNSGASSAKTATLSFTATAAQNGYQYRCIVKDADGVSATSDAAALTVSAGVTITQQPADAAVTAGAKAAFSVTATGQGLTYQWQVKTPNGQWKNSGASSAKTATLSFNTTAAQNGYQYRCIVKNSSGASVTSDAATLTVGAPLAITAQPQSVTVAAGSKAIFTVAATGQGLTYQWQYLAPNGQWKNSGASSAKTATLSFNATAAQNGYQYRCVVKNADGASVTSGAAKLTVGTPLAITAQPQSVTVAAGGRAAFSVAATGQGLTYQWQVKTPNGSWKNSGASSAKTATLSFNATAAQNSYQYRCVVKDANGASVTSGAAALTVG